MLEAFVDAERAPVETAIQEAVSSLGGPAGAAAVYSMRAGGKRVRPLLVVASYRAMGGSAEGPDAAVYRVAAALELVHTYSLQHDDLPAMDDDPVRRGLPTAHRVYGVEVATFAGMALQQVAFLALGSAARADRRFTARLPVLVRRLARAAGVEGMVGGQYMDLEAEGREVDAASLEAIHRGKTAALLSAACAMGGLAAAASDEAIEGLARYGRHLGLAFQIVDDVLDETGDPVRLGKVVGADRARAKATYLSLHGELRARDMARTEARAAREALAGVAPGDPVLAAFVDFVVDRLH